MHATIMQLITLPLAASFVLAPLPALAWAPAQAADEAPEIDPVMEEARRLFDAGVARYTAADYGDAVSMWLEAYALVPPSFENRFIKAELIYNVARAQQKWFEIDQDVTHLRRSRETLERYLGEFDELYGDQGEMEREKISEQISDIEASIAAWEEEQRRREAELAERMRPKFDEEADAREAKRNRSMITAGATLTALGAGGAGMFVTGLILVRNAEGKAGDLPLASDISAREQAINQGFAGTALLVTGSLAGIVFLSAGVPLLAAGGVAERKRKQRRQDAGLDLARLDALSPIYLPGGGGGLSLSGRF